jgi:hypothetical protein
VSGEIGLSLDERIRRSLAPLGGPLRIDAFLAVVVRERSLRSQRATLEARRLRAAASGAEPGPDPAGPEEPGRAAADLDPPPGVVSGSIAAFRPGGAEPAGASDSTKLKAEVEAYLRRDDVTDATSREVADFLDFMGGGLQPEASEEQP